VEEAWEVAQELGPPPWIVKDHVKSAKERWHRACGPVWRWPGGPLARTAGAAGLSHCPRLLSVRHEAIPRNCLQTSNTKLR